MYKQISITLCFVLLFGCSKKHTYSGVIKESDKYNITDFIKSINKFPYYAPYEKHNLLINSYNDLKIGMHKAQVKDILGEPDAEFLEYKGKPEDNYKDNFVGYTWLYYIYLHDSIYTNEGDKNISLYFDMNDILYLAMPDNIDSLKIMGGPHLRHR